MVQKFPNLLVLEETSTKTDSPVLRAYGLVSATRGTRLNFVAVGRSVTSLEKSYARILPPLHGAAKLSLIS